MGGNPNTQARLRCELSRCCTEAEKVLRIARVKILSADGDYPTIEAAVKEVKDYQRYLSKDSGDH